jgi:hypothetical protein
MILCSQRINLAAAADLFSIRGEFLLQWMKFLLTSRLSSRKEDIERGISSVTEDSCFVTIVISSMEDDILHIFISHGRFDGLI